MATSMQYTWKPKEAARFATRDAAVDCADRVERNMPASWRQTVVAVRVEKLPGIGYVVSLEEHDGESIGYLKAA